MDKTYVPAIASQPISISFSAPSSKACSPTVLRLPQEAPEGLTDKVTPTGSRVITHADTSKPKVALAAFATYM